MTITRLIARPMLASMFVVGAVNALKKPQVAAGKAKPVTDRLIPVARRAGVPLPTDEVTLVRLNAGAQLVGAAALATGKAPRLGGVLLLASLVPTTVAGHRFWEETEPTVRTQQKLHFFKNLSAAGGLVLAAVDTEGRPGLAWRARRAAADVRRESRRLAKDARREARLAKARLT